MPSNQIGKFGGNAAEAIPLYYTAKNINETAGSRTAIDDDLEVGMIVTTDPYKNDGGDGTGAVPINVTRPQTSFLHHKKYRIASIGADVNEIPNASAATQRRGGIVYGVEVFDEGTALVVGATDVSVGDRLEVTNGSFNLTKVAAVTAAPGTAISSPYAGTPDYIIANAVVSNGAAGAAFSSADEFGTLVAAVINLQTRVGELQAQLTGGICAVALEAYADATAALKRVRFNGSGIK